MMKAILYFKGLFGTQIVINAEKFISLEDGWLYRTIRVEGGLVYWSQASYKELKEAIRGILH